MRTGCVLLRGSPSPTYHDGTHPRGTREPHPFPTPPWPRGARRGLIPCRGGDGCGSRHQCPHRASGRKHHRGGHQRERVGQHRGRLLPVAHPDRHHHGHLRTLEHRFDRVRHTLGRGQQRGTSGQCQPIRRWTIRHGDPAAHRRRQAVSHRSEHSARHHDHASRLQEER